MVKTLQTEVSISMRDKFELKLRLNSQIISKWQTLSSQLGITSEWKVNKTLETEMSILMRVKNELELRLNSQVISKWQAPSSQLGIMSQWKVPLCKFLVYHKGGNETTQLAFWVK